MEPHTLDTFDVEQLVPGFRPPPRPAAAPGGAAADPVAVAAADKAMRRWRSPVPGPLVPGSDAHREASCRMFRDTFNPYRPAALDWPVLAPAVRERIVSLPIWNIAVQTEGKARLRMAAYAATLPDPDMRDALALNAWEEHRHKEVLARMVAAYGIALAPEPPPAMPSDPEWAYLVTGYSECIDSFFAFGLFELARRSGLFPQALVDTFEPVMQEECRHILLFANWAGWHRARLSPWRRLRFECKVARVWAFLAWERIGLARAVDAGPASTAQDNNFTLNGAQSVSGDGVGLRALLALCLAENERRFAGYDARLLRPLTMPRLVRCALRVMRLPGCRAA
ncbi:ferritin-like domain-containing protein [Massilia phyllosphaerae]|uniref:ferritin-like domain-containing protein n=1 Tax=Massilia phyllosphaerae TaxID=3106034 RepID=UPI002B1CAE52|nr:ferritin-like domain-containing protein [Massilia sp. SGZ-792]